ncbi:tetratricopeptide repeat protein [Novosphingobium cyanobacteriorum]|uniref:Tetratricopeptide repeat protein n=1 Tax=Novosphingobium cyanobacteriorum TaxID=3024215 RepID=A0ABT6CQT4_9SPHN|nr:hypothetical protein [Novosphingobium cyanobacteriorum]MDF8335535.1 hypothetical protein [Novosphingobium cyanobacteriorum]
MTSVARRSPWAVTVPAIVAAASIGVGLILIPDREEVLAAARHRSAMGGPAVGPSVPVAVRPDLEAVLAQGDAPAIAALIEDLQKQGIVFTTRQVVQDLRALGRSKVALSLLALRADGQDPDLWRVGFELARETGNASLAHQMLDAAVRGDPAVPAPDLIEAAFAASRPEVLLAARAKGVVPALPPRIVDDLANRFVNKADMASLDVLDRLEGTSWHTRLPWTAYNLALKRRDKSAALAAAALLPRDEQGPAREHVLDAFGDREALRGLILDQAGASEADTGRLAERLLGLGFRGDAIALLQRRLEHGYSSKLADRLLFLLGPRPAPADLEWLAARASGAASAAVFWLTAYAQRDSAPRALSFLEQHPLAQTQDVLLMRLTLARSARDPVRGANALAHLLGSPALSAQAVRTIDANLPSGLDRRLRARFLEAKLAAGLGGDKDRLALAWNAWDSKRPAEAAGWLEIVLANNREAKDAWWLMADVQERLGRPDRMRACLEQLLVLSPGSSLERARLLDRLGRRREALQVIAALRARNPGDALLSAESARLRVALGEPGKARRDLRQ